MSKTRTPSEIRAAAAARRRSLAQWKYQGLELMHEIVATAERIQAACGWHGKRIFRTDPEWLLLTDIARGRGCPSISDVARRLRITRQAAREVARRAESVGLVDLFRCPDDRRLVLIALTELGRSELKLAHGAEAWWINVLLNGLERRQMNSLTHVLRVIRHRLLRFERDLQEARRPIS